MRVPFLKNFRRGFATNSSSSHSFVYLKNPVESHDNDSLPYNEFHWDDFRLDTIRAKLFYVLVSRIGGYWDNDSSGLADAIESNIQDFPEFDEDDFREALDGSVDHESRGFIGVDEARDPNVVIFGGDDNGRDSQERARAIRNGEVDWSRTEMEWADVNNVPEDDEIGQAKAKEMRKRGW